MPAKGGRTKPIRVVALADADREAAAVAAAGARMLARCEPEYPHPDPPPIVTVLGRGDLLSGPAPIVAIVGARNASGAGQRIAQGIAADLGTNGVTVASGLARGIDTAAHRGSLQTGTLAVVAGGVDVAYPPENEELQRAIAEAGALVSEQPMGTVPQARHFPRRNRLISGLAYGVVVVEAAPRSGSLITARMALEQGREVFAVPGSPLDPRAQGPNHLLRQGATLTEGANDVLAVLAGMPPPPPTPLREQEADEFEARHDDADGPGAPADGRDRVVELIGPAPLGIDDLVRLSRLTPAHVLTILLELEIAGRLQRHPGNKVSAL